MTTTSNRPAIPRRSLVDWIRAATTFLAALIFRPRDVASLIPSSQALEQELCAVVQTCNPSIVVELGPGTGGTTKALLRSLRANATLIAIEIVPEFVAELRRIDDPRLIVCQGDATELAGILSEQELQNVDLVVSGLPFSTMRRQAAEELVEDVYRSLTPGGQFVAYQVRDTITEFTAELFDGPRVSMVLWNVPPLRLYQFSKPRGGHQHAHPLHAVSVTTTATFEGRQTA